MPQEHEGLTNAKT